jgi:hypothetical protein
MKEGNCQKRKKFYSGLTFFLERNTMRGMRMNER